MAIAVSALVLTTDLQGAIGFSSFGVLVYYLIANVSAFTQRAGHRRFPRALQVLGAAGCVTLVATLPLLRSSPVWLSSHWVSATGRGPCTSAADSPVTPARAKAPVTVRAPARFG